MKDIKSLYNIAKYSGRSEDISAYTEAVNELLDKDPLGYITNLEYIISSSIGLPTFESFIDKYGLSISVYDDVMNVIESCMEKCKKNTKNPLNDEYQKTKKKLEDFHEKYSNCFDMYEYYKIDKPYTESYYSLNDAGIQKRRLMTGMIGHFGEMAIPDILITADSMGESTVDTVLQYIEGFVPSDISTYTQFLYESVNDISTNTEAVESFKSTFYPYTLESYIDDMRKNHQQMITESKMMGHDVYLEYTISDINIIKDAISYYEFKLLGLENDDDIRATQDKIYSLYEELDGLVDEAGNPYMESGDKEDDSEDKPDDPPKKKKNTEYVPIFGVVASYSESDKRNDGTDKSDRDTNLQNIKHAIKFMSRGDNYSHACIGLDYDLKDMYSFENTGFIPDTIEDNVWMSTQSIYICAMFVTKEEKEDIKKYLKEMGEHKNETRYAYSNLVRLLPPSWFSKPIKNNKQLLCSTFTGYVLQYSNPKNLHRDYTRMKPEDITILPRSFYVMNVKDRDEFKKKKAEFKRRVKEIYDTNKETIADYNNHLPKLMLKDRMEKDKTFDKVVNWVFQKLNGEAWSND